MYGQKSCGLKIVGQMVFGQNDIERNVIGRNVFGRIVLHPNEGSAYDVDYCNPELFHIKIRCRLWVHPAAIRPLQT